MERQLLTDDDRALLRALLTERIGTGVAFGEGAAGGYSAEQCFRLLKKIDGPGKALVIESLTPIGVDPAVQQAQEAGCG